MSIKYKNNKNRNKLKIIDDLFILFLIIIEKYHRFFSLNQQLYRIADTQISILNLFHILLKHVLKLYCYLLCMLELLLIGIGIERFTSN